MKTLFTVLLLASTVSALSAADQELPDCASIIDPDNTLETQQIEACLDHFNKNIQTKHQTIMDQFKETPELQSSYQKTQDTWEMYREAKCDFILQNSATTAANNGIKCEAIIAAQRLNELDFLLPDEETETNEATNTDGETEKTDDTQSKKTEAEAASEPETTEEKKE